MQVTKSSAVTLPSTHPGHAGDRMYPSDFPFGFFSEQLFEDQTSLGLGI